MTNNLKTIKLEEIEFYDDILFGGQDEEGNIWLAINQTCKALGFNEDDSKNQIKKINQDNVLKKMSVKFYTHVKYGENASQGKEILCLSEKAITLWLAKINITSKMQIKYPELSNKLIKYQLECADVLHEHFLGSTEKKETFFNDMLGLDINKIIDQNNILIEDNNIIKLQLENTQQELTNVKNEFDSFKNYRQEQSDKLEFLMRRFAIYDNPDIKYTRLVDDFGALNGVNAVGQKHYTFWEAICNWTGKDFNILKTQKNKKQWILDNIGLNVCEYFVDNVILGRIIRNDKGNWINLNGFNSDVFNIEKNKIINYWTDKQGNLRCCYCGEVIDNPQENENYNFEHLVNKSSFGSTNTIENLSISCCDCNKEKNGTTYREYIEKNKKNKLINRIEKWRDDYGYTKK